MRILPKASGAEAVLLWLDAQGAVSSAKITTAGATIGRDSVCEIVLPDRRGFVPAPARGADRGGISGGDLQSSNGMLVNGARLTATRLLLDGDVIEVGGTALAFVCRDV
jgi:pSer/pThr/pTyr-binding forkhead associated (FHA) protein